MDLAFASKIIDSPKGDGNQVKKSALVSPSFGKIIDSPKGDGNSI